MNAAGEENMVNAEERTSDMEGAARRPGFSQDRQRTGGATGQESKRMMSENSTELMREMNFQIERMD